MRRDDHDPRRVNDGEGERTLGDRSQVSVGLEKGFEQC